MKKLYLLLLVFLLLFIPATNAVTPYQLDHPIRELNGYTLREVFEESSIYGVGKNLFDKSGAIITDGEYNSSGVQVTNLTNTRIDNYVKVQGNITYYIKTNDTPLVRRLVEYDINYNIIAIREVPTTWITETNTRYIRFHVNIVDFDFNSLQLEKGTVATTYEPYKSSLNDDLPPFAYWYNLDTLGIDNLTTEQMDMYYDYYLEAVQFEIDYYEAGLDPGEYQHIFKSILNGVKNLISEMGYVWQWLNAPIITSDMQDYSFNIDWSWDLIGVIRQIMNSAGILTLQIAFWVPSLAFAFMGIPIQISILSLLFSNLIFLLLGWILVKSLLI